MAKKCPTTRKKPLVGNRVSHANNKTKRRWLPNLQVKRFWVESKNCFVRLRVSTRAIKIIDKYGVEAFLKQADLKTVKAQTH
jgi:large subunit ribosomal protein L28